MGRNTPLNVEEIQHIIDVYKQTGSMVQTRKITGNGHKAISKYLKLYNIPINKRGCSGGSERKITDEEIIEESKTMTRVEIAKKHNMAICNVDRKLKRLGIKCKNGIGTGSGHSHYKERCLNNNVEYDRSIDLYEVVKRSDGICKLCGKPVDYKDKVGNKIGRLYPTIDHIIPLSKGGSHTWDNVQLAHMVCNSTKCDKVV